jgi:serine/threonine-protein kinase PknK
VSLAEVAVFQGRYDEGKRLAHEGTTLSRELGSPSDVVNAQLILGIALHALGRFHEARAQYEECLTIADDLGDRDLVAWAHAELSTTNLRLGHYQAACKHAHHCLHRIEDTGPIAHMGRALSTLGCVALAEGAYAQAHERLWDSFEIYRGLGQQGRMGMGWCLANLSHAARGLRSPDQARQHLGQALRAADEDERPRPRIWAIVAAAMHLADLATSSPQEGERAVELYALASRYPAVANSRWFEEIAGKQIAALAARLPEEVVAAARARGRARDLVATVADLRGEFEA